MKRLMTVGALLFGTALVLGPVAMGRAGTLPPGLTEETIAAASTSAQHLAIADAYARQASEFSAAAVSHRHMDSWYPEPGYASQKLGTERHCRALTRSFEAAAKEAERLAAEHRVMAERAH